MHPAQPCISPLTAIISTEEPVLVEREVFQWSGQGELLRQLDFFHPILLCCSFSSWWRCCRKRCQWVQQSDLLEGEAVSRVVHDEGWDWLAWNKSLRIFIYGCIVEGDVKFNYENNTESQLFQYCCPRKNNTGTVIENVCIVTWVKSQQWNIAWALRKSLRLRLYFTVYPSFSYSTDTVLT